MFRYSNWRRAPLAALLLALPCATGIAQETPDVPAAAPQAEVAAEPPFDMLEIRVIGNTILTTVDIEQALYPFLGTHKTVSDVEAARQHLEQRYREVGYPTVLVNVPEQDVGAGVAYLEVVEGKVDALRIKGSRYFSPQRVRRQLPALAEGTIPYLPNVQDQLARVNAQSVDRSLTPILRPGKTPGTLEAVLRAEDEFPLHGNLEVNNHHTNGSSESRAVAGIRYDNLWQRQHSLSLQYQTSPQKPDEVKVLSGTYLWRFASTDTLLVLYGVQSDSEIATVGDITVIGKGRIGGARGIFSLESQPQISRGITLGFDYKDFDETLDLQGSDTIKTPIRYVNWMAQYNASKRSPRSSTSFTFGSDFGMRGVVNDAQKFENKRSHAKPNYLILKVELEHQKDAPWASRVHARVNAQLADTPLISNEQFSAGGAASVRPYFESQSLGDNGVSGSLEWYTPSFAQRLSNRIHDLRLLGFVDGAKLRVRDPSIDQIPKFQLLGAGIGLRLTAWKTLNVEMDWGIAYKTVGSVDKGDARGHLRVEYQF